MGRIDNTDYDVLDQISDEERANYLYYYLVKGWTQQEIAEEFYRSNEGWGGERVSVVTRAFGFHRGASRGAYRDIPFEVIRDFVDDYWPENYDGGLDPGTFDDYIADYRARIAEEQARQRQAEQEAAEARQRQKEREAAERQRQREWEAAERQRRAQEQAAREAEQKRQAEQRAREEAERQRKEAARQAAIDRGDHIALMRQGLAAVRTRDFAAARRYADQAAAIQPLVGTDYIYAHCEAHDGSKGRALTLAEELLKKYGEDEPEYAELLKLCVECSREPRAEWGITLWQKGKFDTLSRSQKVKALGAVANAADNESPCFCSPDPDTQETYEAMAHYAAQHLDALDLPVRTRCWLGGIAVCAGNWGDADILLDYAQNELYKTEEMGDTVLQRQYEALLGKLYLEHGDPGSAEGLWFGFPVGGQPLFYVFYFGFEDDARALCSEDGPDRDELDRVTRLFSGEITAGRYLALRGESAEEVGFYMPDDGRDFRFEYDEDGCRYCSLVDSPARELASRGRDLADEVAGRIDDLSDRLRGLFRRW